MNYANYIVNQSRFAVRLLYIEQRQNITNLVDSWELICRSYILAEVQRVNVNR
jgi:hypothetical protein